MCRAILALLLLPTLAVSAPVPKAKGPVIDIRDPDGKVMLAADDLVSYVWDTHTLTLKDGAKKSFAKALPDYSEFAVCIDGKPAIEGHRIPPTMSAEHKGPAIVLSTDGKVEGTTVRIRGGYPQLNEGDPDKRDVKELKAALETAGKLKADK